MKEKDFDTALFQAAKVLVEVYSEELKAIPITNIRISKETEEKILKRIRNSSCTKKKGQNKNP